MNTRDSFVAEFVFNPVYRLVPTRPTQRENITKQVRVFRRAVTQPNNNITDLLAAAHNDPLAPTTHRAYAECTHYHTNTVDPDFDISGAAEFDDCLNEEQEARAHGLTIMDDATFFQTYCENNEE